MKRRQHKAPKRSQKTATSPNPIILANQKSPFNEHIAELRKRLFYVVLSIAIWSAAAYAVEHQVINALLAPLNGQKLIYTSPISGMNFLFKVCFYVGIAFSVPVIVYQFLRYLEPLMKKSSSKFIYWGSAVSGVLAVAGMVFGYFVGLPAALHFLLHQFITNQVSAMLTIEAYLSFVMMYMVGAALMFQIPLIVLFINRIKPLTPSQLFKAERWVILGSVVLALIMNPTPSLYDQIFVAGPMIASYQLAIGMIWWLHRRNGKLSKMRGEDARLQAERLKRARELQASWKAANAIATTAETGFVSRKTVQAQTATTVPQVASVSNPSQFAQPRANASAGRLALHRPTLAARPTYTSRPLMGSHPRPLRSNYIQ